MTNNSTHSNEEGMPPESGEILLSEQVLRRSREALIAEHPELLDNETIYRRNAAVLAFDVERYSSVQESSPELAIELTNFISQYQNILIEHGLNCGYERFHFLKSAGDELMFMQDYPPNDNGAFLRTTLFTIEAQIIYNRLLSTKEYSNLRDYYEKYATETNSDRNVTSYIQPGIFLPDEDNPYHLMIHIANSARHGSHVAELLVAGQAASAKYLARKWAAEAEVGTAEGEEKLNSTKFARHLRTLNATQYHNLLEIPEHLDKLDTEQLEELRQTLHIQLRELTDKEIIPLRNLSQNIQHRVPIVQLENVLSSLKPVVEKNKAGELLEENGAIAFMTIRGLDKIRNNLAKQLNEIGVERHILAKVTMETQRMLYDLIWDGISTENKDEREWVLAETEYMIQRVSQIEGESEGVNIDTSEGSLVIKLTRGLTNEGSAITPKDLETFNKLSKKIKDCAENIVELTNGALSKEGIAEAIDLEQVFEGTNINVGIGVVELSKKNNVYAYYQNPRTIGGNASSLAARIAFAKANTYESFIAMPGYMMPIAYQTDFGEVVVEQEFLKGFGRFQNQVVIEL